MIFFEMTCYIVNVITFYVKNKVVTCEDKGDSEEEMRRFVM